MANDTNPMLSMGVQHMQTTVRGAAWLPRCSCASPMPSATRLCGEAHRYVSAGIKPISVGIDDVNEVLTIPLRVGAAGTPSHRHAHKSNTHATRAAAARADASPHDSRLNRSRIGPIHRKQAPHQHLSQHYPRTPRSLGCPPHSNVRAAACLHPYPHTSTHVHASSPTPDHADATHLTLPTTCPLTYPANNTD